MDEDFNTAEAVAVLFDLANQINKLKNTDASQASSLAATLKQLAGVIGLLQDDPDAYLKRGGAIDGLSDDEIERLILQRAQAKADKDWAASDRIRDELQEQGIFLEDKGTDTSWRRK